MLNQSKFFILHSSFFIYLLIALTLTSCKDASNNTNRSIDIQGHRGCRGLMPENSIPGFIRAIQEGVTTLEMDIVISKDGKVLLSHEPFLSHEICLTANGKEISEENEKSFNLYTMMYDSIAKCDCGSKPHPRFPLQQKLKVHKPLLGDLIDSVEAYIQKNTLPKVLYNIETKTTLEGDSVYHPQPKIVVEKLVAVVKSKNIQDRVTIQSFDVRTLQALKQLDTSITTALLVENLIGHEANIKALGFVPDIYSPDYHLVSPVLIEYAHKKKMKVIPWTVNTVTEMEQLINWGVDGIITDYPDSVKQIFVSSKE